MPLDDGRLGIKTDVLRVDWDMNGVDWTIISEEFKFFCHDNKMMYLFHTFDPRGILNCSTF